MQLPMDGGGPPTAAPVTAMATSSLAILQSTHIATDWCSHSATFDGNILERLQLYADAALLPYILLLLVVARRSLPELCRALRAPKKVEHASSSLNAELLASSSPVAAEDQDDRARTLPSRAACRGSVLRGLQLLSCVALLVDGALTLDWRLRCPHTSTLAAILPLAAAAASLAAWALCLILTAVAIGARAASSRALRLWWLGHAILASARTASDVFTLGETGARPTALASARLTGLLLALLLALCALVESNDSARAASPRALLHGSGGAAAAAAATAEGDDDGADEEALEDTVHAPDEGASFASILAFGWLSPMLGLGARRPLELSDLPPLAADDACRHNGARLDAALRAEIAARGARAAFLRAIFAAYGRDLIPIGLLKLGNDV